MTYTLQKKHQTIVLMSRIRKRKKIKQREIRGRILLGSLLLLIIIICFRCIIKRPLNKDDDDIAKEYTIEKPEIDVQLLTVSPYSRPGTAMTKINGIVIHYTANPGTTAFSNRNYFEGLKDSHITKASSHFIVGLSGEIIQCIPSNEISYASNHRNGDTLSIECCHEDDSGKFSKATYESLVHLTAWLCEQFQIDIKDVIRHYDVSGKICPKYYVDHEESWKQFKKDVEACK